MNYIYQIKKCILYLNDLYRCKSLMYYRSFPFFGNVMSRVVMFGLCVWERVRVYSYTQGSGAGVQLQSSSSLNHSLISLLADSTASLPWQMFLPISMQ